jgi:hypothetical protein
MSIRSAANSDLVLNNLKINLKLTLENEVEDFKASGTVTVENLTVEDTTKFTGFAYFGNDGKMEPTSFGNDTGNYFCAIGGNMTNAHGELDFVNTGYDANNEDLSAFDWYMMTSSTTKELLMRLYHSGDLYIEGVLNANTGLSTTELNVSGLSSLDVVDIAAGLNVDGKTQLEDVFSVTLNVDGLSTLEEVDATELNVSGETHLNEVTVTKLEVNGSTQLIDVICNGSLSVTGTTQLNDITISGETQLIDVYATELTISGDSQLNDVTVTKLTNTGHTQQLADLTATGTTSLITTYSSGYSYFGNAGATLPTYQGNYLGVIGGNVSSGNGELSFVNTGKVQSTTQNLCAFDWFIMTSATTKNLLMS